MTKLICVVDMQYDFVLPGGALSVPEAEWLLLPIIEYLADNKDEAYIVYTQDTHDPESYPSSEEAKHFPPHCYEGTKGHELLVPLNWANDIVQKSVFDMWEEGDPFDFGPDDFDSVEIVGVAADYCVKYAYEGFVKRGFKNVSVLSQFTVGIATNPFET